MQIITIMVEQRICIVVVALPIIFYNVCFSGRMPAIFRNFRYILISFIGPCTLISSLVLLQVDRSGIRREQSNVT